MKDQPQIIINRKWWVDAIWLLLLLAMCALTYCAGYFTGRYHEAIGLPPWQRGVMHKSSLESLQE